MSKETFQLERGDNINTYRYIQRVYMGRCKYNLAACYYMLRLMRDGELVYDSPAYRAFLKLKSLHDHRFRGQLP